MILDGPIVISLGDFTIDQALLDNYQEKWHSVSTMDTSKWNDEELLRALLSRCIPITVAAVEATVLKAEIARFPYVLHEAAKGKVHTTHNGSVYAVRLVPLSGKLAMVYTQPGASVTMNRRLLIPNVRFEATFGDNKVQFTQYFVPADNLPKLVPPFGYAEELTITDEAEGGY